LGWTSQLNLIRFYLAYPKLTVVNHGGLNLFWTTHQQQLGWKGWLHLMKSNCVHSNSFSFESELVEMQLVCFFNSISWKNLEPFK
jgi:hypothetical protein